MRRSYIFSWCLILAGSGAVCAWIAFGAVYMRRRFFSAPPLQEAHRIESQFLAILLPRITPGPRPHAMSSAELAEFLGGLQASGYVSIGMKDVAQLYQQGRKLPPKSLLIAFAQDDPLGVEAADDVMKDLRLRGAIFISRVAGSDPDDDRHFLSAHAVSQMRRGGTWDVGWSRQEAARTAFGIDSSSVSLTSSELGLNDTNDDPRALNILSIRADREATDLSQIVRESWPRTAQFSDDFGADGLDSDWIAGWGVVTLGNHRLTILPKPRQSSAGVFLRGTERWRDLTLEFDLKKYQQDFWAYARYREDGGYVRVGARGGHWYVEQKSGPKNLPSILARAQIKEGDLPARVQLVLKGESAAVHVNGRLQFGRVLRIHPDIKQGRILLGVYNGASKHALAVLTSVRAAPLGDEWVSFKSGPNDILNDDHLAGLRDEAVRARVMSPLWVSVAAGGAVTVAETQGDLIRSLAGFYGCRLVPSAEFPELGLSVLVSPEGVEKLAGELANSVDAMGASGLNLRMLGGQARSQSTITFLKQLEAVFRIRHRELWVTVGRGRGLDPALVQSADGTLEPSERRSRDLDLLEAVQGPADGLSPSEPLGPTLTASRDGRALH